MTAFNEEELVNLPGNELFAREVSERSQAANLKARSGRGCSLAVIGAILAFLGGLGLLILTIFQWDTSQGSFFNDIGGTIMMACICPIPLLAAGMGLGVWGLRTRQSATDAALSPGGGNVIDS
jgi:hypothetical protein